MKNREKYLKSLLSTSLTFSLSILALFALQNHPPAIALPANSMWTEPATLYFNSTTTPIGHKFNITVYTNLSVSSYTWQMYLTYNKNHLNATGCWYSAGPKSEWAGTRQTSPQTPSYGSHNATHNYVLFGECLLGVAETPPGTYSLAIVQFQIIAAPPQGETFQSQIRLDIKGAFESFILDPDLNEITLNFGGTTYTYTSPGAPPPPPPPPPLLNPWLEAVPSEYTAIRPEEFEIAVYIRDVDIRHELIGVQFNLTFNPDVIEPIALTEGTFMSDPRWAIYGTYPMWFFENGRALYGELILPNPSTGEWDLPQFPEGEGLIATITFKTLAHEPAEFNITVNPLFGEFFVDKNVEYIPYNPPKSCAFKYEPLPIPSVKVSPEHYVSSSLGQTFQINIDIEDLDGLWNLTYVEFELQFNGLLIQAINATEGSFLSQFGTTSFAYNINDNSVSVNITLEELTESPHGSGTLVTITFNVTSRPPAKCALTLSGVLLLDIEGREILCNVSHGFYEMYEHLIHEIIVDGTTFYVTTLSNGSISPVQLNVGHRLLKFTITGENGTIGFINITIPNNLLWAEDGWLVIVDGEEVEATVTDVNATHTMLSFTASFSTKTVYIIGTGVIPEYSSFIPLMFLLVMTLPAVAVKLHLKRKRS